MSRRRSIPTPPTPVNWKAVNTEQFIVYREPQDDSITNAAGELVQRKKRIDLSGILFIEEDANGVAIRRNTEGFANINTLLTEDVREIARDNPEVADAYQQMIPKIVAFYDAIYNAINN